MKKFYFSFLFLLILFSCRAQLSGTKLINPAGGGDYTSLSEAAAAVNAQGMGGNLTLNLASGTYAEQALFDIPGQLESQMLTIQSATGNEADVVIRFEDAAEEANYQLGFMDVQALTIRNISINTVDLDQGVGIFLMGVCRNVLIDNLHHEGNRNDEGVLAAHSEDFLTEKGISGLEVKNSYFHESSFSVSVGKFLFFVAPETPVEDVWVHDCTFYDADGFLANSTTNVTFENNLCYGDVYNIQGVEVGSGSGTIRIRNNIIQKSLSGIKLTSSQGTAGDPILVYNNMVSGKGNLVTINSNGFAKFVHNTVYGNDDGDPVFAASGNSDSEVLNNIFHQEDPDGYIMSYFEFAPDNAVYNYNNLYSNGDYGFTFGDAGVVYLNYADFIALTGREANGVNVLSLFTNPIEDLHVGNPALQAGTPIAGVTTDIDGDPRDPSTPTIGADELDGSGIYNDLTINVVTTSGNLPAGGQLTVSWDGENAGEGNLVAPWVDRIYLSIDGFLDENDTEIGVYTRETNLGVGQTYLHQQVVTVPLDMVPGNYRVVVKVNADATLNEDNVNNVAVSVPLQVLPPVLPDLVVTNIEMPETVFSGTTLQVGYTVANEGEANASGAWKDRMWITTNIDAFGTADFKSLNAPFASANNPIALLPGGSYSHTLQGTLPMNGQGWHYIIIETDANNHIAEGAAGDDNFYTAMIDSIFVSQSPLADLHVLSIESPAETFAGEEISITYTVENQGTAATSPVPLPYQFYFGYLWSPLALGDWLDYVYFSDTTLSFNPAAYKSVNTHLGILGVNETYTVTKTFTVPQCISGPYLAVVGADRWNHVAELDEFNNLVHSDTIQVLLRPSPDFVPFSNDPLQGWSSNNIFEFTYTILNQGADTAKTVWQDRVFLSDSMAFQFNINEVAGFAQRNIVLPPDTQAEVVMQVQVAPNVYGQKYLHLWIDANNEVCEAPFDDNNFLTMAINIAQSPSADLSVAINEPSNAVTAGDALNLGGVVANVGPAAPNSQVWKDFVFLLPEDAPGDTIYIERYLRTGGLAPGASYPLTGPFFIPLDVDPGVYTLGVKTDGSESVWENESDANNLILVEGLAIDIDSLRVPDLRPFAINFTSPLVTGTTATVEVQVENLSGATGVAAWLDALELRSPAGTVLATAGKVYQGDLGAGGTYTAVFNLAVPGNAAGDMVLAARIDTGAMVLEYNRANNILTTQATVVQGPAPDLNPSNFFVPESVNAGQIIHFDLWRNQIGDADIVSRNWVERVLLSIDNQPGPGDIVLRSYAYTGASFPQGTTELHIDSIHVPLTLVGSYFVIYVMDATNMIAEGLNEGNNYVASSSPLNITLPLPVDFDAVVTNFNIGDGNLNSINYDLINTSGNAFSGKFYNQFYYSTDAVLSTDDQFFAEGYMLDFDNSPGYKVEMGPGEAFSTFAGARYVPLVAGDYYIIMRIDAYNHVYEANENNNVLVFGPVALDNVMEIFPDVEYDRQFNKNLPTLQFGGGYSNTDPPDKHDYKIDIPDGFGMITRMWANEQANQAYGINNSSQPIYEMYVGEGFVPTPSVFDFRFDSPLQSDQTVLVPVAGERTDYIKTTAPYIPPHYNPDSVPISQYKLKAEFREFSVYSLHPEKIGTLHNVTMRIKGFDLADTAGLDVALILGTDTTYAYETYPQTSSELIAYIDMRGKPSGEYALMVRKRTTADVTVWEKAVDVVQDEGAIFYTNIIAPPEVRVGQPFQIQVEYGNRGLSNEYDMTFFVSFFMDDTTSNGINVRFLGSDIPGDATATYVADEQNPPGDMDYSDLGFARVFAVRIPILHADYRETFAFEVTMDTIGVLSTVSTFGMLPRSQFTFTGRMEDAETSYWGIALGNALLAVPGLLEEFAGAKAAPTCIDVLNVDFMTKRLATETVKVAKKARGAQNFEKETRESIKKLTGKEASLKDRYDGFKKLVEQKGELDLTASDATPFANELQDVFNCIGEENMDFEVTGDIGEDGSCTGIRSWELNGVTFKVPVHGICTKGDTPLDRVKTIIRRASDPNEIIGPTGEGALRLVENTIDFHYTVYFENVEDADAPAVRVRIDNPLDTNLRIQSMRIQSFGFADTSFQFNNVPYLQTEIGLGAGYENQRLRVLAGFNALAQKAFFEFITIDPNTQTAATGPGDGFLFPNDSTGRGEGFVSYVIRAVDDLPAGTEIHNQAAIIFDENEIIETNTWVNTIGGGVLASRVLDLPRYSSETFRIDWVNETPAFGPPVRAYDIFYRVEGSVPGGWELWLGETRDKSKFFTGVPGTTYAFKSVAKSAQRAEVREYEADAVTTIVDFRGALNGGDPLLFPNPAIFETKLAYMSYGEGRMMRIDLTDVMGRLSRQFAFVSGPAGVGYFLIPVNDLEAGVYLVTLHEDGERRGTAKLVVVEN